MNLCAMDEIRKIIENALAQHPPKNNFSLGFNIQLSEYHSSHRVGQPIFNTVRLCLLRRPKCVWLGFRSACENRNIMRYRTMHHAISCDIMRYRAISHDTAWYRTIHHAISHDTSCDIAWYRTIHRAISCDIAWYRTMHRAISHDISVFAGRPKSQPYTFRSA